MTSILGLDISSFQINACLLRDDEPPLLRTEIIGKAGKDALVDRLGRIPAAMALINPIKIVPRRDGHGIRTGNSLVSEADWLVVEEPFGGKNIPKALLMTAGACLSTASYGCRPWLITPGDWRHALDAKNTKPDGHRAVYEWLPNRFYNTLTPDELDAIGIALGARKILEAQE